LENALEKSFRKRSLIFIVLALIILPFLFFPLSAREEPLSTLRNVSPSFPYLDYFKLIALPLTVSLILYWRRKILPYFLFPLLLFDLIPNSLSHLYFVRREEVFPPLKGIPENGIYRVMGITPHWSLFRYPPASLPPNSAMVYHLHDVGGYDSLFPLYYKSFLDNIEGRNSAPLENGNMLLPSSVKEENLRLLGVKYIFTSIFIEGAHLQLIKDGETKVYLYKGNPLRFYIFNETQSSKGKAKLISYEPNKVEFEVQTEKEGYFIFNDTYYPGWRAYIDGKEEKISPFYVFRSVSIPKGKHILAFIFRPFVYKLGLYLSLLTLILLCSFVSFKIFISKQGGELR
jgi:hypothetical protein